MNSLRKIAIILAGAVVATNAAATLCPGPDGGGYSCTTNPAGAAYTSAPNLIPALNCDDCSTVRNIGFTFTHYGATSTTVRVISNTWLQPGAAGGSNDFSQNCAYPNVGGDVNYAGRISDANNSSGTGQIADGTSGVAPNRVYAVQWTNVPYFSGGGLINCQIQLHENGGAGQMVRIISQPGGQGYGDVGMQNATETIGIELDPCNGAVGSQVTHQFLAAALPPSSCNLAPIEAKLDDGTRFTSDAERTALQTTLLNSNTAQTTTIVNILNDGTRFTNDAERTALQNTLVTEINANETKIDRLEVKLDTETRFTDDGEFDVGLQAIAALEAKADEQGTNLELQLQIETEHAMSEDVNVNKPMSVMMLPAAFGGRLEQVRDVVVATMANTAAAGCSTGSAAGYLASADAEYALGHYNLCYVALARAYQECITGPCN